MRRSRGTLSSQPALLGGIAVLMAIVAIYVVYHADAGLPFVPAYEVEAVIPDAEHFGKTGDVRMAGVLVGRVGERRLEQRPDGTTRAVLELRLEKDIEPLAADSKIRMRAQSSLGSSYVELIPGHSSEPLRGSPPTIDAEDAPPDISLADALEAYDRRTRGAMGRWLGGSGDALAGRGRELHGVIAAAPETARRLEGAGRTLASPSADLAGFVRGFARLGEVMAPAAEQQAGMFRGLDLTLGAMASGRGDVAAAVAESPPLLDAGIRGFPAQRRLMRETAGLLAALRPGFHAARGAADDIAAASTGAAPAFDSLVPLSPELAAGGRALSRLAREPIVLPSLRTLAATFRALGPTVGDLAAAQGTCNYLGLTLRNLQSVLSDGMSTGNFVNVGAVLVLPGPDGEAGPAAAPAHGPPEREDNYLHSTLTPSFGAGPDPECEAGNETYAIGRQAIGPAPGRQPGATEPTKPGRPR
jgi:ABC-type transporter Mla subunit MlaD